jgi:thymidine phosphorylase
MVALISDLEEVLGNSVGNALQIHEVIDFLEGREQDTRLKEVVLTLCAEIVVMAGVAPDLSAARTLVEHKLDDGSGAHRFAQMVAALGGPTDLLQRPSDYLPSAAIVAPIYAAVDGIVQGMDCFAIGMALVALGAGRVQPDDAIDYAVGISRVAHVGDAVGTHRPLCLLHAQTQAAWEAAARTIREAVRIGPDEITPKPVLRQRISSQGACG